MPSDDEIYRILANQRSRLHDGQRSQRKFNSNYEFNGIKAEFIIGQEINYAVDLNRRPAGDKGKDFWLPNGETIDVKGSSTKSLLVEEGHVNATYYVMVSTRDWTIRGWEMGKYIERIPPRVTHGKCNNHEVTGKKLLPWKVLKEYIIRLGPPKEPFKSPSELYAEMKPKERAANT